MKFQPSEHSHVGGDYGEPITVAAITAVGLLGSGGLSLWGASKQRKAEAAQALKDAELQKQLMEQQAQQAQLAATAEIEKAKSQAQLVQTAVVGLGGLIVLGVVYKMWSKSATDEDEDEDETTDEE
jgi:hypothetical protein